MDGDSSGSNAVPGHPSEHPLAHVQVPADRPEGGGPEPVVQSRPRKFTIQSTFGIPRERRSRKSRPCDACRRRKTACIITTEPPCAFCRARGMKCLSTAVGEGTLTRNPPSQNHAQGRGGAGDREQTENLESPNTAKSSPGLVTSPSVSGTSDHSTPRYGNEGSSVGYSPFGFNREYIKSEPDTSITSMDIVQPALNSPESSIVGGTAHTLEDNPGRATYYLGSTAEQDPFVLDAFSYGILSETSTVDANVVQLHRGGSDVDDLPLHFLFLSMGHPKHTNLSREEASDAIETKVWPHADVLVRLYFKHVHPIMPLLSKVRFLRRYASNRKSIPACLRGAVYALAAVFWPEDSATRSGDPFPFQQHEIVDQAHRALRREIENPNLFVVQACLLLIHVQPPSIDAMEAPSTFTLAAQATAAAQLIGLHQDPSDWNLELVEKKLRKKIWWSTFVTDCWAAIALGNPPHINETSFNTAAVTIDDLRCDEDVPDDLRYLVDLQNAYFDVSAGARFLESIRITRYLRGVLDCSFQVNMKTPDLLDRLQFRERLVDIHDKLNDWPSLIPSCLVVPRNRDPVMSCLNCPLHLMFYASKVLLYRALMHPATKAAKSQPNSYLRQWFAYALTDFTQFTEFFVTINPGDLRGFWGRHREHIEAAHKILEDFRVKVNKISLTDHVPTKALIRATTIRCNSFFAQAAAVMRHGPEAAITEPITVCGTDGTVSGSS
ncbi:hypothetical protein QQS21_009934 [Conoideocrella luteorostrata]|uniref:Zn(2)-C6 fungal-type domain-containing protein n=1 Tax=Conoideocrella luteorostrata TaxID=1105319 RepID=A0AAJ0CIP6_9HYPO|nr:hypothetical protein QQS21_009934 [Conoideocrella luteorostrata]